MVQFTIKRGDSFNRSFVWKIHGTNTLVDLAGATSRAQLRDPRGTLVAPFVVAINVTTGTVSLSLASTTALSGSYLFDIEVTFSDGSVQSTPTMMLIVDEDITHD